VATALLLTLATALGVPWWRRKGTPSPLYEGGPMRRGMCNTIPRASCALLSSLVHRPPPLLSLLCLVWPPEGLRRNKITQPLHAVVLRSFWILSKVVYFRNLSWIGDFGRHHVHRTSEYTEVLPLVAPKSFHQVLR
jgi:hypothetical protein